MKVVKWFILVVVALLGVFITITWFLPREYRVQREIEIAAPAELIYSQVVDLEAWQEWNPWHQMDPDMRIEYGPVRAGEGAWYKWQSELAGDGQMVITRAIAPLEARYELSFEDYEELPSYSSILLTPQEGRVATVVVWTFEGNAGEKFFARWMSVMVDKFVGPSYEKGLATLKERCEALHRVGKITAAGANPAG